MERVQLPNSLDSYFAFHEDERTGDFRKFHFFLPYSDGPRVERLHWEWKVSGTEEATIGVKGVEERLQKEKDRFVAYVASWLKETKKVLRGDAPLPLLVNEDAS